MYAMLNGKIFDMLIAMSMQYSISSNLNLSTDQIVSLSDCRSVTLLICICIHMYCRSIYCQIVQGIQNWYLALFQSTYSTKSSTKVFTLTRTLFRSLDTASSPHDERPSKSPNCTYQDLLFLLSKAQPKNALVNPPNLETNSIN
jgi:hypothetical protein